MTDLHDRFAAIDLLDPPDHWDEIRDRAGRETLVVQPTRPRWVRPVVVFVAAAAVVVLLGLIPLVVGRGGDDVVDQSPPPVTEAPPETPTPTIVIPSVGLWNTALNGTLAKAPPAAATCDPDAAPDTSGPSDQARPSPTWTRNLAAAFDHRTATIVYVDAAVSTWSFDVCMNTWHRAKPTVDELIVAAGQESAVLGQLVYDVDSGLIVSLGYAGVGVYDASSNHWELRGPPSSASGLPDSGLLGAVYDPVSGLVITSTMGPDDVWSLWAYDVDGNDWIELGALDLDRDTPCCTPIDLLGYSAQLDRLILTTYYNDDPATLLIDPRNGKIEAVPDSNAPIVDLVWPSHAYGQANDTVYVYDQVERALCSFDAATLTWVCHDAPTQLPTKYTAFAAIADDPLNQRVLLINGIHGDWWSDATDDVWSVDIVTDQWVQLRD